MTGRAAHGREVNGQPIDIDITVAYAARIHDYLLGGADKFEVDRRAVMDATTYMPGGLDRARAKARASRAFLGRATRWLACAAGIRQFLDIGTGIPNADNMHRVAQQVAPDSRIVYVDNDPVVLAHAHTLLNSTPEGATAFIQGDLREPCDVVRRAHATLDFDNPVAVLLSGVLDLIGDEDTYNIVSELMDSTAPGSYLAITHGAADIDPHAMAQLADRLNERSHEIYTWRTEDQVALFFTGLELIEPGVVSVDRWRPDPDSPPPDHPVPCYGAIARRTTASPLRSKPPGGAAPLLDVGTQPEAAGASVDDRRRKVSVTAPVDRHDAARRQAEKLGDAGGVDQVVGVDEP